MVTLRLSGLEVFSPFLHKPISVVLRNERAHRMGPKA